MHVLVTGGAGFIGSHTCVELIAGGHDVVVVDEIPHTATGKIQKTALRDQFKAYRFPG